MRLPLVILCASALWAQTPPAKPAPAKPGAAKPDVAKPAAPAPPPVPRWPDGRVNLGSTPEHKGYWEIRPGGGSRFPRAADVPMQPWARALYTYRAGAVELHPPLVHCKPAGGPGFFNSPGFEIVDVPELKQILILNIAGAHSYRIIYMDGRPHPSGDALRPTYLGHSTGTWDGDTLVIDTVGFNEKQWISGSYPTTSQLHLTERITRRNVATIDYEVTFDDPGAYTAPWSGSWTIGPGSSSSQWVDGGEIFEYICQNER